MNTKDRCIQCGCRLNKDAVEIKTKEGLQVCSNWCKDDWEVDTE